jgi:hypothetical protein
MFVALKIIIIFVYVPFKNQNVYQRIRTFSTGSYNDRGTKYNKNQYLKLFCFWRAAY